MAPVSKHKHGGSRPKVRSDDRRGGAGRGQGRPYSVTKIRKGDHLIMERETIGGNIQPLQMWCVLSIGGDDGNVIEFQCDDDIIVLRPFVSSDEPQERPSTMFKHRS